MIVHTVYIGAIGGIISLEECRKLKKALEVQLVGDDSSCSYDNSDFLPSVLVPHWNVHMCERNKCGYVYLKSHLCPVGRVYVVVFL